MNKQNETVLMGLRELLFFTHDVDCCYSVGTRDRTLVPMFSL